MSDSQPLHRYLQEEAEIINQLLQEKPLDRESDCRLGSEVICFADAILGVGFERKSRSIIDSFRNEALKHPYRLRVSWQPDMELDGGRFVAL